MKICFCDKTINYEWLGKIACSKIPIYYDGSEVLFYLNGENRTDSIHWRHDSRIQAENLRSYYFDHLDINSSGILVYARFNIRQYADSRIWLEHFKTKDKLGKEHSLHSLIGYQPNAYKTNEARAILTRKMHKYLDQLPTGRIRRITFE